MWCSSRLCSRSTVIFNIYINDLELYLKDVIISQYADDTVISYSDPNLNQINEIILENLQILATYPVSTPPLLKRLFTAANPCSTA